MIEEKLQIPDSVVSQNTCYYINRNHWTDDFTTYLQQNKQNITTPSTKSVAKAHKFNQTENIFRNKNGYQTNKYINVPNNNNPSVVAVGILNVTAATRSPYKQNKFSSTPSENTNSLNLLFSEMTSSLKRRNNLLDCSLTPPYKKMKPIETLKNEQILKTTNQSDSSSYVCSMKERLKAHILESMNNNKYKKETIEEDIENDSISMEIIHMIKSLSNINKKVPCSPIVIHDKLYLYLCSSGDDSKCSSFRILQKYCNGDTVCCKKCMSKRWVQVRNTKRQKESVDDQVSPSSHTKLGCLHRDELTSRYKNSKIMQVKMKRKLDSLVKQLNDKCKDESLHLEFNDKKIKTSLSCSKKFSNLSRILLTLRIHY